MLEDMLLVIATSPEGLSRVQAGSAAALLLPYVRGWDLDCLMEAQGRAVQSLTERGWLTAMPLACWCVPSGKAGTIRAALVERWLNL